MIRQPEQVTIEVNDVSEVPLLLWIAYAYAEGEVAAVPARIAIAVGALVAGILIGVKL